MKIRILKIFAVILAPVCLLGTYLTYNYRYRRAITYNSLNVIKDVRSQGYFPTAGSKNYSPVLCLCLYKRV